MKEQQVLPDLAQGDVAADEAVHLRVRNPLKHVLIVLLAPAGGAAEGGVLPRGVRPREEAVVAVIRKQTAGQQQRLQYLRDPQQREGTLLLCVLHLPHRGKDCVTISFAYFSL